MLDKPKSFFTIELLNVEIKGKPCASAIKTNPDQKVSVRGDRATAYENVSRVLDVCKGAGVQLPYLETVPTE